MMAYLNTESPQNSAPIHTIDGQYIKEWLILTPYLPDDLDAEFLAEMERRGDVYPKEGDAFTSSDGQIFTWKRYMAWTDAVKLHDVLGQDYKGGNAFALCVLRSETEGSADIIIHGGATFAVWVDTQRLQQVSECLSRRIAQGKEEPYHEYKSVTFSTYLLGGMSVPLMVRISQVSVSAIFRIQALPPNRALLSGKISDETGMPLSKVILSLEREGMEVTNITPSSPGVYRLSIFPTQGDYSLKATCDAKSGWWPNLSLCEGENRKLDLTLRETSSISGKLLMLDDETPHAGVAVQAIRDAQVVSKVFSDERGTYRFVHLEPGTYQVRCQVLGGYVYYGSSTNDNNAKLVGEEVRETLPVENDKKLEGIDFRFARFKRGVWRSYNAFDGLPSNNVQALCRASDGMMWFGTHHSNVSRYDSKKFTIFTTRDGLIDPWLHAIHCMSDGILWFGTKNGITRYDGKEFKSFTTEDGLAGNDILSIGSEPTGILWIGTDNGLSRYDGELRTYTIRDGLPDNVIRSICRAADGCLWFGTDGGIARFDGREFVCLTSEDGLALQSVNAIYEDHDGSMWFAGNGGISLYDGGFTNFNVQSGLMSDWVTDINQTPDGFLWFSGEHGISRFDGETFVHFTPQDGLADGKVNALLQTPDGLLWCATEGAGIAQYDERIISFTTKDGLTSDAVFALHIDSDNAMWIGARGLYRYDGTQFVQLSQDRGNTICPTPDGVLWFGTDKGVLCHNGTEFLEERLLEDKWIMAIHRDANGVMWFGQGWARGGVSLYDEKEIERGVIKTFTTDDGLAHNIVWAIESDKDGVVWLGSDGGVSRYDGGKSPPFPKGGKG